MIIDKVIVGNYQTNCYILSIDNDCLVIDPGDEYEKIKGKIGGKKVLAFLITHKHFDHIGALKDLDNIYNVDIYDYSNLEEKEYNIKNFKFSVIYTKGHTNDSITYYFKEDKAMFVGDFIFENSIGRTDLATGDYNEMINSIEIIKSYDDDITIYPGHGNMTNLGNEKINNYWFDKVNQ